MPNFKMSKAKKSGPLSFAGIFTVLVVFGAVLGLVVFWAFQTEDSEIAESIRKLFREAPPVEEEVVIQPEPEMPGEPAPVAPTPETPVVPPPVPSITMDEISRQKFLWPRNLSLTMDKQVPIRYNDKEYGFMEFSKGMPIHVDALTSNGEVLGKIDGNYLSLSVHETDFVSWFEGKYSDRYVLEDIVFDDLSRSSRARFRLGTEQGDAEFWSEMRIWCHQNYDSVSLEIGEDSLIFRWLPREDVEINYDAEAREIARKYLTLRNKFGSPENFAACEIRHPVTDEFLGSSSMFIPRF